jgi:hypothetical protein
VQGHKVILTNLISSFLGRSSLCSIFEG